MMAINPEPKPKKLRVLFLASEADPLVKIGGLGDVMGSLPRAIRALSPEKTGGYILDVRLAIPYHAAIRQNIQNPKLVARFSLDSKEGPVSGQAFQIESEGIPVYLVDGPPFRRGDPVYGTDPLQDAERYSFFPLAALETVRQLNWPPEIVHANDWHTALATYSLMLHRTEDPFFATTRSVLTVHNLSFMGVGTERALANYGLPASKDERLPVWARQAPLPLGLLAADQIVAVSPTYAREMMTPEFGCGLENFLITRSDHISGIINGLDPAAWDPTTDSVLSASYTSQTLSNRQVNTAALLKEFNLEVDPRVPVLILISRMDQQKGVDLAVGALRNLDDQPWQAILLGTGDSKLEEACRQLERDFPTRVRAATRFDSRLARRMYAGGDILLMPSRYEPCGTAQMIAMRYGCVPLAHATGGLKDTIQDYSETSIGTGFLFTPATVSGVENALRRALSVFSDKKAWQEIQKRGMHQDFSWQRSAQTYARLYLDLRDRLS